MEIEITQEHFKKATTYSDGYGCPLYQALNEKFPHSFISVGWNDLSIDKKNYSISKNWSDVLPSNVDCWIDEAKQGLNVESIIVNITEE